MTNWARYITRRGEWGREKKKKRKRRRKKKREKGEKNVDRSRGHSTERRRWSLCTRGQRARTKDEHERGGEKGNRESAEDAFRCATRGIKDGRDFGNAGLYAANNQCILVCCLGLHGRLHRDKCNAANLLTPSLTYRVSEKLMDPTLLGSKSITVADKSNRPVSIFSRFTSVSSISINTTTKRDRNFPSKAKFTYFKVSKSLRF